MIRDAKNCEISASYTITEPEELLIVDAQVMDVTCNGQSDGSIDVTITGGTMPYSYDWDNDGTFDFDDPEDLENLSGGTYVFVVRDAQGCETTGTYVVGEPTELIIEGEPLILDVSCNGYK